MCGYIYHLDLAWLVDIACRLDLSNYMTQQLTTCLLVPDVSQREDALKVESGRDKCG